jgi:hypothetical protein
MAPELAHTIEGGSIEEYEVLAEHEYDLARCRLVEAMPARRPHVLASLYGRVAGMSPSLGSDDRRTALHG